MNRVNKVLEKFAKSNGILLEQDPALDPAAAPPIDPAAAPTDPAAAGAPPAAPAGPEEEVLMLSVSKIFN